jgi:hypothetical protein
MKTETEIKALERLKVINTSSDGGCGEIYFPAQREPMAAVWSFGGGWEHVSVSYRRRTPTWDEMCKVKDMFWNDEETVVQYHPKKSEYKNLHPYCLHLWRKCGEDFELPPREYV